MTNLKLALHPTDHQEENQAILGHNCDTGPDDQSRSGKSHSKND